MFRFLKKASRSSAPPILYKREIVRRVARTTGQTKREVTRTVAATLTVLEEALRYGQKVSLIGFGTFYVRDYPEGSVRSVRSGVTVRYPAARRPAFRAGENLKRAVR